jgi:hypothetical protein
MRWTTERAMLHFRHLAPGPAQLEVAVHGHRGPVSVAAGGVVVGVVEQGGTGGTFAATIPRGGAVDVELRAETFTAGDGRVLGTLLDAVALHAERRRVAPTLLLAFVLPALGCLLGGAWARVHPGLTVAGAVTLSVLQGALLWRHGVMWSPYAVALGACLAVSVLVAAAITRGVERHRPVSRAGLIAALSLAAIVNGVLATAPFMVVSDAVLNVHLLDRVAGGDLFPVSRTQHGRPFTFPYGVSFYALLAPVERLGMVEDATLLRAAAGISGFAAVLGLLWLLPDVPRLVVLLSLLPGTFDRYSFGNLPNVFGQAMTVLFVAWWVSGRRGWVGGMFFVLAGLGHFSSAIVLAVLCVALVGLGGMETWRDRRLRYALLGGGALVLLYYVQFIPLMVSQLSRLLEGGGSGRESSHGVLAALRLQLTAVLSEWGWPALLLAAIGWTGRSPAPRERALLAFWAAGLVLAVAAVVSPVEVRYVYALTLPVAVAGAAGLLRLWDRGGVARAAAVGLGLGQAGVAAARIVHDLWFRYRPGGA